MPKPFEPGVPLGEYRKLGAAVELSCGKCMLTTTLDLEKVIAGLAARGRGGEHTGIRAAARTFSRPCERCGAVAWETRPAFPELKNKGIPDRAAT